MIYNQVLEDLKNDVQKKADVFIIEYITDIIFNKYKEKNITAIDLKKVMFYVL